MSSSEASDEILRRMLSPEGMAKNRAALVSKYEWLYHVSRVSFFPSIKENGLRPSFPGAVDVPPHVKEANVREMVCLSPWPRTMILRLNTGGEHGFRIGVHRDLLPDAIGIDWSQAGTDDFAQCAANGGTSCVGGR